MPWNGKGHGFFGVVRRLLWRGLAALLALWTSWSHASIGGLGPIESITATGNGGIITSIDGVPVTELRLGVTTFPGPPSYADFPAANADNFNLSSLASGDGQAYIDVRFSQAVMAVFLIENHGNDSGFMQALDASGVPVGPVVPFGVGDYFLSSYRTGNGQMAAGLMVWMQTAAYGVRLTPPNGGVMGFDPVSVSALLEPSSGGGGTFAFNASDDAYLQGTTRYNDSYLKVEAGKRVSYLKFVVSGISGNVAKATLRLQEGGDTGSGTLRVYRGSHNNWTETTLTTANAPAESGQVGQFTGTVTAAQILNIDVTPLITGVGTYSVILKMDAGGNDVWFGSRTSTRAPQLIVETTEGTVTYSLTVNSGSGSGNYAAGTVINIVANSPPAGQVFDRWTGSTAAVANVTAASTTLTMPAANAAVTATYRTDTGSGGIGGIGPIESISATGNAGFITSINGISASQLQLGVTVFPNAPKFSNMPARNADNFDLNLLASGDDQPFIDIYFSEGVLGVFLIENHGNDSGSMQGLDATGAPVGPLVGFNTSHYYLSSYKTANGQTAAGLFVWMQEPVYGVRIVPPSGSPMGFDPVSVSALPAEPPPPVDEGIGDIGPVSGITATGNAGLITSIHGISVAELQVGVTTFPAAPKHADMPARNADNFDLNLLASGDDQPYFDVYFGRGVMTVLLVENHGNDSGSMQGLSAEGVPVGPVVSFSTADYFKSSYLTRNGQVASGLIVSMQSPVFGIRINPPSGGVMGFDPVSVSAVVEAPPVSGGNLAALANFSEAWNGQTLVWRKASFTDPTLGSGGSSGIPFGLAHPGSYAAGAGQKYPLVVYLHGADARGNNDNKNLRRETARFFAHQSLTATQYRSFVLSPQVPDNQRFVGVEFSNGPYQQSSSTLTTAMQLTENLIRYLIAPENEAALTAVLGIKPGDIDKNRLYIVGDSMGAYGTWDALGRAAIPFAGAIAASGSGPKNRLAAILGTPLWVIHGEVDSVVPNYLPDLGDADGAGSLGMLALLDPAFNNTSSTLVVRLDNYSSTSDDPSPSHTLVYTQYPAQFDHASVAAGWTGLMGSNFSSWLFSQTRGGNSPSIQLVPTANPPYLQWEYDSQLQTWTVSWPGLNWVLQHTADLQSAWSDVQPPAQSPYPISADEGVRFFRLRTADQE